MWVINEHSAYATLSRASGLHPEGQDDAVIPDNYAVRDNSGSILALDLHF